MDVDYISGYDYCLHTKISWEVFQNYPTLVPTSKEGNGNPLQYSCLENLMDVGMGNTCKPMAVSFQCMTKSTTIKKKEKKKKRKSHGWRSLVGMGSLIVKHNWATSLSLFIFMHWRRKWQPTPVFLPGESQGRAWWAAVYGVSQSQTWLKQLSSSSSSSHLMPSEQTYQSKSSGIRVFFLTLPGDFTFFPFIFISWRLITIL